jgi:hypothetical protein
MFSPYAQNRLSNESEPDCIRPSPSWSRALPHGLEAQGSDRIRPSPSWSRTLPHGLEAKGLVPRPPIWQATSPWSHLMHMSIKLINIMDPIRLTIQNIV